MLRLANADRDVYTAVQWDDVRDINTEAQTATARLSIQMTWLLPHSTARPAAYGLGELHAHASTKMSGWRPEFVVTNADDVRTQTVLYQRELVRKRVSQDAPNTADGTPCIAWTMVIQLDGDFKQSMNLTNFPYDTQAVGVQLRLLNENCCFRPMDELEVWLGTYTKGKDKKVFQLREFARVDVDVWTSQAWLPTGHSVRTSASEKEWSTLGLAHPQIEFLFHVHRNGKVYMYNVSLPVSLVSTLSWASLSAETVGDQVALSFAMLLTLVASKVAASEGLPKTNDLTLLDQHVLVSIVAVTLVVLCNLLGLWDEFEGDDTLHPVGLSKFCGAITFVFYAAWHAWFWLQRRHLETMFAAEGSLVETHAVHDSSDLVSRVKLGTFKNNDDDAPRPVKLKYTYLRGDGAFGTQRQGYGFNDKNEPEATLPIRRAVHGVLGKGNGGSRLVRHKSIFNDFDDFDDSMRPRRQISQAPTEAEVRQLLADHDRG